MEDEKAWCANDDDRPCGVKHPSHQHAQGWEDVVRALGEPGDVYDAEGDLILQVENDLTARVGSSGRMRTISYRPRGTRTTATYRSHDPQFFLIPALGAFSVSPEDERAAIASILGQTAQGGDRVMVDLPDLKALMEFARRIIVNLPSSPPDPQSAYDALNALEGQVRHQTGDPEWSSWKK